MRFCFRERSKECRGQESFQSRRARIRYFVSYLIAVAIAMTVGVKPIRYWRRDVVALLSRNVSSLTMLPMADAFVSQSANTRTKYSFRGAQHKRSLLCLHSSSLSQLSMVVVPELDDSFPDDYNNENNNNSGESNPPPPLFGEDYFPGVEDFQLEGMKEEEEVINPFPFPGPSFTYTEDGVTGSNKIKLDTPTHSVPEPISTDDFGFTTESTPASVSDRESDLDGSISRKMKDELAESSSISGTSSASSPNTFSKSKNETGRRTMATIANDKEDESPPSEEQDLWQSFEPNEPSVTIDQETDQDQFAPYASIMEDSGPVKPLVAPLKLSPVSDSPADINAPSDASTVPSIEANGLDDLVDSLQGQLKSTQREIEVMAGDKFKSINLNSPKQISQLLFGRPDMSTNKSTLEGMAASNILAKLVLDYRDAKRRLNKVLKQQELREASNSDASSDPETFASSSRPRAMKDPVLLFDTSSFIFRAYYSSPPIHRGRDGMPIGAVMGFCSMINKLLLSSMLRGETPILVHCLDAPGKSFRSDLYPEYKAHRPPVPLDLVPQFNLIKRAVKAYGMIQIQAQGYEADDVIATLATIGSQTEGLDVRILSGDKDLMQLVTEDDESEESASGMVHMVDPMSSKVWNHNMVVEKWGVKASQLGDVLALAGDAADNVPGVPGIGPKIAAQLLQEFGSLESLLDNTDQIPQPKRREKLETNVDSARISRELVELKRELDWSEMEAFLPPPTTGDAVFETDMTPTPILSSTKICDLRMQPIQPDRILAFYDDMGFHKLKTQLTDRLGKIQLKENSGPNSVALSAPLPSKPSSTPVAATKTAAVASPTKPKPKRNYWEKTKRGVPKPEDYKDVPF